MTAMWSYQQDHSLTNTPSRSIQIQKGKLNTSREVEELDNIMFLTRDSILESVSEI